MNPGLLFLFTALLKCRLVSGLYDRLEERASEGDWFDPDSSKERWQTLRQCRMLYERSREALMSGMSAVSTPYMKHLECLAICRLGQRTEALNIVRSYWGGMLAKGATTFFEAFAEDETAESVAKFYDRPFGRSLCENPHCMSLIIRLCYIEPCCYFFYIIGRPRLVSGALLPLSRDTAGSEASVRWVGGIHLRSTS